MFIHLQPESEHTSETDDVKCHPARPGNDIDTCTSDRRSRILGNLI